MNDTFIYTGNEPCNPNPCLHNGVCMEKDGMPVCTCKFPHVGPLCNGKTPLLVGYF